MSNAPTALHDELAEEMAAWARLSDGPRIQRAAWVQQVTDGEAPTLALETLCELATECSPAGSLATIHDLINGLVLRHADDDATTSALMAIAHYHLPNMLDELLDGLRDDS